MNTFFLNNIIYNILKGKGESENIENIEESSKQSDTDKDSIVIPSKQTVLNSFEEFAKNNTKNDIIDLTIEFQNVKEQLCAQGGLSTFLSMIEEEGFLHKKLVILELITKALIGNDIGKQIFKDIDGYSNLIKLFDNLSKSHLSSSHSLQTIEVSI